MLDNLIQITQLLSEIKAIPVRLRSLCSSPYTHHMAGAQQGLATCSSHPLLQVQQVQEPS